MRPILALVLLLGILPAAEARQYLDPVAWEKAAARPLRRAEYLSFPGYAVVFHDSFGTWRPGEQFDLVDVGAGRMMDRRYAPYAAFLGAPGTWGGAFTCYSPVYPCLGINAASYTLPYKIIGMTGHLTYSAWGGFAMNGIDAFDNAAFDQAAGGAMTYSGFFGTLFDRGTRVLDLGWLTPLSDNASSFHLADARVLVRVRNVAAREAVEPLATSVPEPSTLVLFALTLTGLLVSRRVGPPAARPRPSTTRPGRATPPARCPA